jgi:hypothetical protein
VYGGGLYLDSSAATLTANSVTANTAAQGGGLFMDYSPAWLSANSVTSNTANSAGGLFVFYSNATFTNTVVAGNRGRDRSSGLFISGGSYVPPSETRLLHTTIAGNWGGDGSGLYVVGAGTVWLTDTILVRQTLGITVAAGSTATMNSTLWYANGADWSGAGTFDHSGDTTGDPAFVDPGGGDYHIGPASAAIDRGVAAGVTTDKDGRPRDAEPDLGAYEAPTLRMTKSVDRDPAPAGAALTYTVLVTNDLDTPQVVTAFDVLPGQVGGLSGDSLPAADLPPDILDLLGGAVDPAAVVAYSTTTVAPGATWAWPIPDLVVQPGYSGTLTNTVALTSATGRHALYVLASTAVVLAPADTYTYLPVIMKASR